MQATIEEPIDKNTVVLVISDTHLRLPVTRELGVIQHSLVERINKLNQHKDAILVLNGDIFELWEQSGQSVADIIDGFRELTTAIQEFTERSKHRVFYVLGNHDGQLPESPTDRALVQSRWHVQVAMELVLLRGTKKILLQHGHQYDPFNAPATSGGSRGKKVVQQTLPTLQKYLPFLFNHLGDVVDRGVVLEYVIANFLYRVFVPVVVPTSLLFGTIVSWHTHTWRLFWWVVMVLGLLTLIIIILGLISRWIAGSILGGGDKYFNRVDGTQKDRRVDIVLLGHTHRGGVFKKQKYIYANSGCNDIVALQRTGWLGLAKFDRRLQLSSITIDFTQKPSLQYYQQDLPLVE